MGACLNQQPAVRVVIGPLLPIALVAPELDDLADVLEGQVERRLPKLLDELPGVRFVARGRQLVMDCQAHVVSFSVSRAGSSGHSQQRTPHRHHLFQNLALAGLKIVRGTLALQRKCGTPDWAALTRFEKVLA